ncbi:MAG: choice-of-anchor Q domain-containing protein [Myxococcota bacterium]
MSIRNTMMLALIAAPFLSTTAWAGAGVNGAACLPSLAAAITAASSGDTIYVAPGTYTISNQTITKDLDIISANNTCNAATTKQVTFEGNNSDPMFTVAGAHVFFRDVTMKNNSVASGNGPILRVHSTGGIATLDNTVVKDGSTGDMGGCIDVHGDGTLALTNGSEVDHCDASGGGGGVRVDNGTVYLLSGTKIRRNSALGSDGGGIHSRASYLYLQGEVSDNSAVNGGGVYTPNSPNQGSTTLIGELSRNSASGSGGGFYSSDIFHDARFVSDALVEDNTAAKGGGAYLEYGTLTVSDQVEFVGNVATGKGGGVYIGTGATLDAAGDDIGDIRFDSNEAGSNGGAIAAYGDNVSLEFVTITGNEAGSFGGGVHLIKGSFSFSDAVTLDNVRLLNNVASSGGGLYTSGIDVDMASDFGSCDPTTLPKGRFCSEVRFNDADGGSGVGGGIRALNGATVDVKTTSFRGNEATQSGDAVSLKDSGTTVSLTNTLVTGHGLTRSAVRAANGSTLNVSASTFSNNGVPVDFVSGTSGSFHRNIVWNNFGTLSVTGITGNCNLLEDVGAAPTGSKNVVGNPSFDSSNSRSVYKLQSGSAAIDACGAGPINDLDGTSRAQGANYDRGAFEMP